MRRDIDYLQDILTAISAIERYTLPSSDPLNQNELLTVWYKYHLQLIGESASKLSPAFRNSHPQTPWDSIIGMRKILIHEHFGINMDEVTAVIKKDLPVLKLQILEYSEG